MCHDLGRNYFDRRSTEIHKQRLLKRLAELGCARTTHGPVPWSLFLC
jgi:hypothetical protein